MSEDVELYEGEKTEFVYKFNDYVNRLSCEMFWSDRTGNLNGKQCKKRIKFILIEYLKKSIENDGHE